jgi:thiol-disulfide isomerase/thioredoxin
LGLGTALLLVLVTARAHTQQNPIILDLPAPALVGEKWLNTPEKKPIELKNLKGKVTIVHFWTFGCINCKRNLPAYARWQKRYSKKGVTMIGVHTPETEEEKDFKNVQRAVKKMGITYPVLFDEKNENWLKWQQQYWPTVYILDKRGNVRAYWVGELAWIGADGEDIMSRKIEALLEERYTEEKPKK